MGVPFLLKVKTGAAKPYGDGPLYARLIVVSPTDHATVLGRHVQPSVGCDEAVEYGGRFE